MRMDAALPDTDSATKIIDAMAAVSAREVARLVVRLVVESDLLFMQRMLYEAANATGELWPPFEDSMREPRNRRFWDGWMTRPGDLGVIAELSGMPIGAAWIRRMGKGQRVPGDDPDVPVLAIGVERDQRGWGVGALLMRSLLDRAREARVRAIDLTASSFNEVAVRLYHAHAFADIGDYGDAIRMRAILE
jgi:ribosomal protein S18 acetylase RimI-like enzyme